MFWGLPIYPTIIIGGVHTYGARLDLDMIHSGLYTSLMNTSVITIKTDTIVKTKAEKVAKELGLSLNSLVNNWLSQLIKTKKVTLSTTDETPNAYLKSLMRQAEKDLKAGKASPSFDNAKDAIAYLEKQGI